MSTINITPFTDVLLVLLIIFIILAAVTKEPPLPLAYNHNLVTPSQITVQITKHDQVQIGSNIVPDSGLKAAFQSLQEATGYHFKSLIVKADPKSTYGTLIKVMNAARSVQLTGFGLANKIQGQKT